MTELGELAAALAKAQSTFPPIKRDKVVTVKTKTGGSYTFAYAPLEAILEAVREPLASNGLAFVQAIDTDELVTTLLHSSGAFLEAHTRLPESADIQAFGSAITYLRRYALQAMLGIATEEDDDGNVSAGNEMTVKPNVERGADGSLIGMVQVGDKTTSDFHVRNTPDGPVLGFRLRGEHGGEGGILVRCRGQLAKDLDVLRESVIGHRATCWGKITTESFRPSGAKKDTTYEVLDADRVSVPGIPMLPTVAKPDAERTEPTDEEIARLGL